jgi:hypothetical protein
MNSAQKKIRDMDPAQLIRFINDFKGDIKNSQAFYNYLMRENKPVEPLQNKPAEEPDCICKDANLSANIQTALSQRRDSANCIHFMSGNNTFVKVQVSPHEDPLLNEIIITRALNSTDSAVTPISTYVVKYRSHCRATVDQKHYPCLLLEALPNIKSLGQVIKEFLTTAGGKASSSLMTSHPLIQTHLSKFLVSLKALSGSLKFSHNDLHHNNIVFSGDALKMIDYGRAWIGGDTGARLQTALLPECARALCITDNQASIQQYLHNHTGLQMFQIRNAPTHLCDMATVCINTLIYVRDFVWPPWLMLAQLNVSSSTTTYSKDQLTGFTVGDRSEILAYLETKSTEKAKAYLADMEYMVPFYDGIGWLALCIRAYMTACSAATRFISFADLRSTLLYSNSCFNPFILHSLVARRMVDFKEDAQQTGGRDATRLLGITGTSVVGHQKQSAPTKSIKSAEKSTNKGLYVTFNENGQNITTIKCITEYDPNLERTVHIDEILNNKNKISELVQTIAEAPPNSGGRKQPKQPRHHVVRQEPQTKRKFILKSNSKWYLDEHRNQYRYAQGAHTHVTMRTKRKTD